MSDLIDRLRQRGEGHNPHSDGRTDGNCPMCDYVLAADALLRADKIEAAARELFDMEYPWEPGQHARLSEAFASPEFGRRLDDLRASLLTPEQQEAT